MAQIQFKPIEKWPSELTKNRQRARFDSTYTATVQLLNKELDKLNAQNVRIGLWLGFGQIKNDGTPYADARPSQPGVIVRFAGKHGEVEMACDEFDQWRDNLRAIALSLEALRKVDRYGCSKKGQQYTGWKALPPAPGVIDNPQAAANFIAQHCKYPPHAILTNFNDAYREAASRCHPDTGGSHDLFVQLQAAAEIIKRLRKEKGLL